MATDSDPTRWKIFSDNQFLLKSGWVKSGNPMLWMYVAIATWKSDKQVWMEMERGFKTGFVLIKLFRGKTVQILFADFMNMKYLITLCFAGFMQINYWQIRTLRRAPPQFLRPCEVHFSRKWVWQEMVDLQMLGRRRNTCSAQSIAGQRSLAPHYRCFCRLGQLCLLMSEVHAIV